MRGQGRALSVRPVVALGLLVSVGVLLVPASAPAAITHPFLETFGSANHPSLAEAEGLAVDQSSGDLYVVDRAPDRMNYFAATGALA